MCKHLHSSSLLIIIVFSTWHRHGSVGRIRLRAPRCGRLAAGPAISPDPAAPPLLVARASTGILLSIFNVIYVQSFYFVHEFVKTKVMF